MAKVGRPTVMTPQVREQIIEALKGGNFRQTACDYAGISNQVFYRYLNEDEDFRRQVIKAEKASEIRLVGIVARAALQDARHAEWLLTHRFRERWDLDKTLTLDVRAYKNQWQTMTDEERKVQLRNLVKQATEQLEVLESGEAPLLTEGTEE